MKYLKYVIAILIIILLVVWAMPVLFIDHIPYGTLAPNHDENYIPEILLTPVPTIKYEVEEYPVNSFSSDISMQQILEALQIAYESGCYTPYTDEINEYDPFEDTNYNGNIIEYIPDYSTVNGNAGFRAGDEFDSLIETVNINIQKYDLSFYCDRFESVGKAIDFYKESYVNRWIIGRDYEREDLNIINNSDKGYCICFGNNGYRAAYLIDDMVIYYYVSVDLVTTREFEHYQEFCNILKLPTDESINELITESIKYNR